MDVCKYLSKITGIPKILIPTTFGTGAEMTTYAVISFEHKKKLLHDEAFLADVAIIDPYFLPNTPFNILRNSACDAAAQASEGYDSKLANPFTKLFCKEAFDILEDAIINDKHELLPYGAMLSGIGFGNSSTTLGHALSYVTRCATCVLCLAGGQCAGRRRHRRGHPGCAASGRAPGRRAEGRRGGARDHAGARPFAP